MPICDSPVVWVRRSAAIGRDLCSGHPKAKTDINCTGLDRKDSSLRSVRLLWLLRLRVPFLVT